MEGLILVLLGFMVAAWFFTIGAAWYVLWRYAYKPWLATRKDMASLNEAVIEARELAKSAMKITKLRAAEMRSDAEVAAIEQHLMAESLARAGRG